MAPKKLIIFDFDGVLINTVDLSYSLHVKENPWMTRKYFDDLSHGNFHENVDRAVKEDGFVKSDNWYTEYSKGITSLSTHDIISHLVKTVAVKHTLVICSSMESKYIHQVLEKEGLSDCFADVFGADVHRSKVVKINALLEKYNLSASDAVFITDTLGDIRDGSECAVSSIGVTWGNHDRETLEKGSPFAIVDTVQALEEAIETFFKNTVQ